MKVGITLEDFRTVILFHAVPLLSYHISNYIQFKSLGASIIPIQFPGVVALEVLT